MKKSLLLLPVLALSISCGKKTNDQAPANPKSSASNKLTEIRPDHKITRRYDISSIHDYYNKVLINNYIDNINIKDLKVTLGIDESLDPTGCFTDDPKLGTVQTLATPGARSFTVNINFKQSLAPIFVYCPVETERGLEIKEYRILPDIYVTDQNKDQFINWASEKRSFDHVVFNLSETFYIKNRNLNIKANKFVNLNIVTIANFPDGDTAPDDQDGLSGGAITLTAKEAVGELRFRLNGQNGGKVTFVPKKQTKIHPEDPSLNGDCSNKKKGCKGRQGKAGFQGKEGFTGKDGGSNGTLHIRIYKSLGLYFYIRQKEGLGSLGGEGGEGGVGQQGGYHDVYIPPTFDCGQLCIKPIVNFDDVARKHGRAPSGPVGPKGERGNKGRDGLLRKSHLVVEDFNVRDIEGLYMNFFGDRL